jgi:hypothetical protein
MFLSVIYKDVSFLPLNYSVQSPEQCLQCFAGRNDDFVEGRGWQLHTGYVFSLVSLDALFFLQKSTHGIDVLYIIIGLSNCKLL